MKSVNKIVNSAIKYLSKNQKWILTTLLLLVLVALVLKNSMEMFDNQVRDSNGNILETFQQVPPAGPAGAQGNPGAQGDPGADGKPSPFTLTQSKDEYKFCEGNNCLVVKKKMGIYNPDSEYRIYRDSLSDNWHHGKLSLRRNTDDSGYGWHPRNSKYGYYYGWQGVRLNNPALNLGSTKVKGVMIQMRGERRHTHGATSPFWQFFLTYTDLDNNEYIINPNPGSSDSATLFANFKHSKDDNIEIEFENNKYMADSYSDKVPLDNTQQNSYKLKKYWGHPMKGEHQEKEELGKPNGIENSDKTNSPLMFSCYTQLWTKMEEQGVTKGYYKYGTYVLVFKKAISQVKEVRIYRAPNNGHPGFKMGLLTEEYSLQ